MQQILTNTQLIKGQNTAFVSFKTLMSIIAGAAITFVLFVIMQKLIHQDSVVVISPAEIIVPDVFINDELDSKTQTKAKLPEKPKMMEQPKPVESKPEVPDDNALDGNQFIAKPQLVLQKMDIGLGSGGGDARPIVRVPPRYPLDASRDGIEGWVQLEFTIDSNGTVKDVKVTDSEPKRIFDKEAKRALRKWKYKPQVVDGRATDLPNMQVVLDFKLES